MVRACHWPRSPAANAALERDAAAGLDWPLVVRIARRHRVEGLVRAAIRAADIAVPPESAKLLGASADGLTGQNLRIAAESGGLAKAFAQAGIPILFVKGISLAQLAYGNILLKSGWDIDILVPPAAAPQAAALLAERGYLPTMPTRFADEAAIAAWHRLLKESVWRHPGRGLHVELHTALADHPMLLPGVGNDSPIQEVAIGPGLILPTLAGDELFAYLCVHGASSAWFRLKWVADLAALLAPHGSEEIGRLYRRSQELGAGRAADIGLILCHDLFGTAVDPALVQELRARPANRRLLAAVRGSLTGRAVATELSALRLGTLGIHRFQTGVMPGLRFKLLALGVELRNLGRFHPRYRPVKGS